MAFHKERWECLGYVWYVYDMCMICVWYVYDMCMICVWYVYDMCMICVWYVYDIYEVNWSPSKNDQSDHISGRHREAHRLVLSMASDPLFAMLSGSFAEGSGGPFLSRVSCWFGSWTTLVSHLPFPRPLALISLACGHLLYLGATSSDFKHDFPLWKCPVYRFTVHCIAIFWTNSYQFMCWLYKLC